MKPFRTDGLQKTLQTPQGNFFCLGSLCADFFREVKFVDVLLRDFIADVAPAPDQELSQGHAPMLYADCFSTFWSHAGGNL